MYASGRNLFETQSAELIRRVHPAMGRGAVRRRFQLGVMGALLGCAGCAPTISKVHAEAVRAHLAGLAKAAHQVAEDAPRHPRCAAGDDPVVVRASALDEQLSALAADADDHADGSWPSQDAFREALSETSDLQSQLSLLRAEYDACRALSARPTDLGGTPLAAEAKRFAALEVIDPGVVADPATHRALDRHLRARLAPAFPLVSPEAVSEAQLENAEGRRCPVRCALAVGREVGAHKVIAVQIERNPDKRCTVILEVHDLATGLTERARTVREGCSRESLLAGLDDAISPLVD